ncbi:retrotransposon protein, putative, ty1-copia subclass [Tanacetum coccineum]|uniref:DNA-directed RNA polymerase subunit n=1 Tax=Tanacetum coccineum TaxID=301880 RepID=A0ABQ5C3L0_9ASTR
MLIVVSRRNCSVVVLQIQHGEATEKGKPKVAGLSDPRLGTRDRKTKCDTCMANMADCPGHFGHLELAKPMFHVGFMKTVLSIMRCVCFSCSKLLADEKDYKFKQALKIRNPKNRLKQILDACKSKRTCQGGDDIESVNQDGVKTVKKGHGGCGSLQPTITIDGMKMVAEYKLLKKKNIDLQQLPEPAERKQQLSAERVLSLLKRISDDGCLLLGLDPKYARPDWMIMQVLPIPPPPVRPSVMMDTSTRCEATQRSGHPIKSICSRLKAKEGRIRGNLMGKHVDFLARTVITPDPTINIDELGVPWSIALNLTYPETVTPYNKERSRLDMSVAEQYLYCKLGVFEEVFMCESLVTPTGQCQLLKRGLDRGTDLTLSYWSSLVDDLCYYPVVVFSTSTWVFDCECSEFSCGQWQSLAWDTGIKVINPEVFEFLVIESDTSSSLCTTPGQLSFLLEDLAAHVHGFKGQKGKLLCSSGTKIYVFKQAEQELLQTVREFQLASQEEGQLLAPLLGTGEGNCPVYSPTLMTKRTLTLRELALQGLRGSRKLKPGALSLYVGDGHRAAVEAIGTYHLELPSGLVIVLNNCHYAPSITRGVISVSRLFDDGFINRFDDNNVISVSKDNLVYFMAVPRDGIFEIDMSCSNTNDSSMLGKMARKPYSHQVERAKDLLGLIHTDVCGPFRIVSRQGASYFVTFTDDFSRYGYVYLLKHKHEVFETFKVFQKEVENQLGKTIKSLRSDRGGEYMSQEFLDHLKEHGIIAHRTPPYTPQNNGVSERRNRTLLDMVRSMMSQTTLPKSFWDYALETAARILNMVPSKKVDKTPYEIWHGQAPKLSYLRVWGCEAFVKHDTLTKPDKLDPRSFKCIFIGYPKETMGYSFYSPSENKVFVARNAEFFESKLLDLKASGSVEDLELIQEEDTNPSVDTSLNHEEDDQEIDEPQSDINPIRRSTRTRRPTDRLCLYI